MNASSGENIVIRYLEEEMRDSYIDYSMSVIVSRALPDVRDGLKPVHRRILYAMRELNLIHSRAHKKSARLVGEVMGKYHPHGDSSIYDSIVRMAQDFSMRAPLVDGQGNFGSVDGDPAAAMRYTETRMTRIAEELLKDIDRETVDFVANFDNTLEEPTVLPANFPNLIVNGSSGIAVGMATNIPPHNLGEVIDGTLALIDNPDITIPELMEYIVAPDFPTGGLIFGMDGVRDAYLTGRGRVLMRAKANIEKMKNGREHIIISEIPYQVNKSSLIEKIAELARDKKIVGINDIRDESDRDGMRIYIELKRDAYPEVILNLLFKHTQMQWTFGVNLLALVKGVPQVLNLKKMLEYFIEHRHVVIVRRTKFDLETAEKRAHILEGLKIAIDNIDEIIELIKKSKNPEEAKGRLIERFKLSDIQAKSILEMRLQRLTGLEREKIETEYKEIIQLIEKLNSILLSKQLRMDLMKEELGELKKKYADKRRTELVANYSEFTIEDMIAEEDMVITISHLGFIKRYPVSGYRRQHRGGRGSTGASTREEDYLEHLFIASTHHYILFFTDKGRCYWLRVHEVPLAGKASKGRAIVNLLEKDKNEKLCTFVSVKHFDPDMNIIMATRKGVIKKTLLSSYSRPRRNGINAISIREDDDLIEAKITDGTQDIVLGTHHGQAIRFKETDVRPMGRTATGVRGVRLRKDDFVVGMVVIKRDATLMVVTEKGFGKRSFVRDYRITRRGGVGIITIKTTERIGKMITIQEVVDEDDLMIITTNGVVIRLKIQGVNVIGRNTQGVRLIRLDEKDNIADVTRVAKSDEEDEESEESEEENFEEETE
ncbi:DNA gyrase subunit A [candidate division KSB1 bacterium]|nr:DNA gyrase subunit A [candidate division KSB1 bacterium]